MNKKIMMVGGLAAASFVGALALAYITTPRPKAPIDANHAEMAATTAPAGGVTAGLVGGDSKLSPKETQLDELIREVRLKMAEVKQREAALDERESRLTIAQDQLKKQAKELEGLQIQLLAPLAAIKDEQEKLEKGRVKVAVDEKVNLKRTAAIYEKMDAASGGRILAGMCEQQMDDVVKILFYMTERSAAKILGEIQDKTLAARLTERLKRVKEEG